LIQELAVGVKGTFKRGRLQPFAGRRRLARRIGVDDRADVEIGWDVVVDLAKETEELGAAKQRRPRRRGDRAPPVRGPADRRLQQQQRKLPFVTP
jgi:hypothetical protein